MSQTLTKNSLLDFERIEDQIEQAKIELSLIIQRNQKTSENIVQKTAGLLGKNFVKGVDFENQARKSWSRRSDKIGL